MQNFHTMNFSAHGGTGEELEAADNASNTEESERQSTAQGRSFSVDSLIYESSERTHKSSSKGDSNEKTLATISKVVNKLWSKFDKNKANVL
jgi:hypothetical protein